MIYAHLFLIFLRRDAIGSELFNRGIVIPSRGGWTCSGICVMRIFAVIHDLVDVNFSPRLIPVKAGRSPLISHRSLHPSAPSRTGSRRRFMKSVEL